MRKQQPTTNKYYPENARNFKNSHVPLPRPGTSQYYATIDDIYSLREVPLPPTPVTTAPNPSYNKTDIDVETNEAYNRFSSPQEIDSPYGLEYNQNYNQVVLSCNPSDDGDHFLCNQLVAGSYKQLSEACNRSEGGDNNNVAYNEIRDERDSKLSYEYPSENVR